MPSYTDVPRPGYELMEGLVLNTQLTLADWQAYQQASSQRLSASGVSKKLLAAQILAAAVVVVVIYLRTEYATRFHTFEFLTGIALALGLTTLTRLMFVRFMRPGADSTWMQPSKITFEAGGVRSEQPAVTTFIAWTAFRDVTVHDEHVFVWLERLGAQIIPVRALPPGVSAGELAAWMRQQMGMAQTAQLTNAPLSAADEREALSPPALIARLLTFRKVDLRNPARISDLWIALPGLCALALYVVIDRVRSGSDSDFYSSGFAGVAWYTVLVMLIAWLISRLTAPRIPYKTAGLVVATFLPVAVVVDALLTQTVSDRIYYYAPLLLVGLGAVYLTRALWAAQPARAVVLSILVAIAAGQFASRNYIPTNFWYAAQADENSAAEDTNPADETLYEQPGRVAAELSRIAPRVAGKTNIFFVGFAGYGDQKVFAEEIKFASQVVGERYGSADRSVLLLNDRRDQQSSPLASVPTLRSALAGVASRMNIDEDVLFLVLSSHGSRMPLLSVENGMLPLQPLTGDSLKSVLDASGIRNRVIVISACHAGAFINTLKDDHTIILTAAAADKTSFGCSDDRDLTYFGEALFRDALPKASSLRAAFAAARAAIAIREKAEDVTASDPQAWFGPEMERLWAPIETAPTPPATVAEAR